MTRPPPAHMSAPLRATMAHQGRGFQRSCPCCVVASIVTRPPPAEGRVKPSALALARLLGRAVAWRPLCRIWMTSWVLHPHLEKVTQPRSPSVGPKARLSLSQGTWRRSGQGLLAWTGRRPGLPLNTLGHGTATAGLTWPHGSPEEAPVLVVQGPGLG